MFFEQLFDPESSTYTYLIADFEQKESILIDPVYEQIQRYLDLLNNLQYKLKYTIETHTHADHITAALKLRTLLGSEIVVSDRSKVEGANIYIKNQDIIKVGAIQILALSTPGHTDDSMSFYVENKVFTGDCLLIHGCGRTDFQNGDPVAMYHSIYDILFQLPNSTTVYPAHDYHGCSCTSIEEERQHNPRLTGKSLKEFVELMQNLHLPPPQKIAIAIPANLHCGSL